jgi:hypothetical protein
MTGSSSEKKYDLARGPAISPADLPIVPQLGYAVGNVHYRFSANIIMCMFWEGEKRGASGPTDNIHKMPS